MRGISGGEDNVGKRLCWEAYGVISKVMWPERFSSANTLVKPVF